MAWLGVAAAFALIGIILIDAFEAMILPRRLRHGYRLARLFYRSTWGLWRALARRLPAGGWRQGFLSVFGPLSLFALMTVWAVGLVTGFALLHWSLDTSLASSREVGDSFGAYLYFSGTTFFTLGYGDIVPTGTWGRALAVTEAGIGFGFLAVVISYLPTLYQAFARREIIISLMDARAGSPPSAGELLRRLADSRKLDSTSAMLAEWERWAAELLESHLSFPVLSFYRSQHDNQSWVAALTTMLDTSALLIASVEGSDSHQARLTFAMARHAAVDLGMVFHQPPVQPQSDRLPPADYARLRESLRATEMKMRDGPAVEKALTELRSLYEAFINALATQFQLEMPPFMPRKTVVDNWQTCAWMRRSPGIGGLPTAGDVHYD